MTSNEYNEIQKELKKLTRSRMDPLTKLVLFVIIGVPILLVVACFALWKLYKACRSNQPKKSQGLKYVEEEISDIPATDTLYYEVKKVIDNKYSLTQYVSFLVLKDNEFIDVTKSMKKYYPDLRYYSGKSPDIIGTAVLTDYDIIKLYKSLDRIHLVRTVGN